MYVNKDKLRELMGDDSYRKFAKKLGVDARQLHRVLNDPGPRGGGKFLGRLSVYCAKVGCNFSEYIFLP